MKYDSAYLRLSIQQALLGAVTPSLRSVFVGLDDKTLRIWFFFDGEISAKDREIASIVAKELIAEFPSDYSLDDHYERVDSPKEIPEPETAWWVYERYEEA